MPNAKHPVDPELFAAIRTPFGLCASRGGAFCFGLRRPNIAKNRTDKSLWLWQGGAPRRLKAPADFTGFWWYDDYTLLLARPGNAADKKRTAAGLGFTSLETLPLAGGAPQPLARLGVTVQDALPLSGGRLLLLAEYDPAAEVALAAAGGDADKAAALLRGQAGCTVLDELPFWQNGAGITNGKRGRLYLWHNGTLAPLTDDKIDVETVRLAPDESYALCIAKRCGAVAPVDDRLLRVGLPPAGPAVPAAAEAGPSAVAPSMAGAASPAIWADAATPLGYTVTDVTFGEGQRHAAAVPLPGGTALVACSDGLLYGINQNPTFYRLDFRPGGKTRVTLLEGTGLYSGWQSVGNDVALPAAARWCAADGGVYWLSTLAHSSQLMFIDTDSGAITQRTHAEGAILELAESGGTLCYTALRGLAGPELYRLDPTGAEQPLSHFNTAALGRYTLARPALLRFKNSRGRLIEGWVLAPPGLKKGQKCPAVLCIHGGPKTVYGTVLFHEMQLLAARGFAVLFCNPTGSDGGGDEFADIRGAYGTIDCEDVLTFLDTALAQNSFIDPARIGVCGGSYGGFLTNWLIGHTHRFAAAVSQRGISSWGSMALTSDIGYYFQPDQVGCTLWENPEAVWDNSPLKYAPSVTTPTLFIHSEQDYRCPLPEGLQMYSALQLAGVPTRLCLFHGETHELSRSGKPQNRLRRLAEICAWFEKYLTNRPAAPTF